MSFGEPDFVSIHTKRARRLQTSRRVRSGMFLHPRMTLSQLSRCSDKHSAGYTQRLRSKGIKHFTGEVHDTSGIEQPLALSNC